MISKTATVSIWTMMMYGRALTQTTPIATFNRVAPVAAFLGAFLWAFSLQAIDVPESATASAAEDHVQMSLIFNEDKSKVGVLYEVIPEWHIYWFNSGESGMATRTLIADQPADMLTPKVFLDPSKTISTFGFEKETLAFAQTPKTDEVVANVSFLVCKVECIPGRGTLRRSLSSDVSEAEAERFASLLKEETVSVDANAKATDGGVVLTFQADGTVEALPDAPYVFIPAVDSPPWKTRSVTVDKGTVTMTLEGGNACAVQGVVPMTQSDRRVGYVVDTTFDCETTEASPAESQTTPPPVETSVWWILLLAFVGGLILNLMPCVFPVLAIKVAALADHAGDDRRGLFTAAYVAGILVSMWTLAAIVIGFRAAGSLVGWGFQFQQPMFVAVMFVVLLAFAINLLGAFEFIVSASIGNRSGVAKSFAEGVLSVVLATPCSAPILGTAVGFAFAGSTFEILAVFTLIGLGLGAPFVVLVFLPWTERFLPKPGPWMIRLKQVLAVALFATAVWLAWLVYQSAGAWFLAAVLTWGAALAASLVWYGRKQFEIPKRIFAPLIVLAIGAALLSAVPTSPIKKPIVSDGWAEWSEETVGELQSQGRVVFVDFTADWCITCKVNENGVLVSKRVKETFEAHDVALLKADWTNPDDAIAKTLSKYGRAGVPMYLVIGHETELLPELLTEEMVVNAVEKAAKK